MFSATFLTALAFTADPALNSKELERIRNALDDYYSRIVGLRLNFRRYYLYAPAMSSESRLAEVRRWSIEGVDGASRAGGRVTDETIVYRFPSWKWMARQKRSSSSVFEPVEPSELFHRQSRYFAYANAKLVRERKADDGIITYGEVLGALGHTLVRTRATRLTALLSHAESVFHIPTKSPIEAGNWILRIGPGVPRDHWLPGSTAGDVAWHLIELDEARGFLPVRHQTFVPNENGVATALHPQTGLRVRCVHRDERLLEYYQVRDEARSRQLPFPKLITIDYPPSSTRIEIASAVVNPGDLEADFRTPVPSGFVHSVIGQIGRAVAKPTLAGGTAARDRRVEEIVAEAREVMKSAPPRSTTSATRSIVWTMSGITALAAMAVVVYIYTRRRN